MDVLSAVFFNGFAMVARRIAAYTGRFGLTETDGVQCFGEKNPARFLSQRPWMYWSCFDSNHLPIRHPYSIKSGNLLPDTRKIKRHKNGSNTVSIGSS
ncbi:hypothetical protein CEXT_331161 [Caerostris extrusa]|uniref:Uncharacterized protein n=1 Tax=Caerostris extrusa TaxID=172846 RepID=A0AAV4QNP9_CAEEX|nr:hypothetical protein CEXT_331161 [Caerostris extrusa]